MKLICINKCFAQGSLWLPGQTLEASSADEYGSHFKPYEDGISVLKQNAEMERLRFESIVHPGGQVQVDVGSDRPIALSQYGKPQKPKGK